jgi:hypothetical protein
MLLFAAVVAVIFWAGVAMLGEWVREWWHH